jgi:hypothetical protein
VNFDTPRGRFTKSASREIESVGSMQEKAIDVQARAEIHQSSA